MNGHLDGFGRIGNVRGDFARNSQEDDAFAGDTHDVEGLIVNGEKVKALNPSFVEDWARQRLSLTEAGARFKEMQRSGDIPRGYRLPKQPEVVELKREKQRKIGKITETSGVSEDRFNFLTDDGDGIERSSEWSVGSSLREQNKGTGSTEKRKTNIEETDVIFLVKDGNAGTSANK